MADKTLTNYIKDTITKIHYLSQAANRRCSVLEQNISEENSVEHLRNLIGLCDKVRKNCEYFHKDLLRKALNNNIQIEEEQISLKHNALESSNNSIPSELDICIRWGIEFKNKSVNHSTIGDIDKFWSDLVNFVSNYDASITYPTDGQWKNVVQNFGRLTVENGEGTPDEIESTMKAIFGSDTDEEALPKSSSGLDKNKMEVSSNEQDKPEVDHRTKERISNKPEKTSRDQSDDYLEDIMNEIADIVEEEGEPEPGASKDCSIEDDTNNSTSSNHNPKSSEIGELSQDNDKSNSTEVEAESSSVSVESVLKTVEEPKNTENSNLILDLSEETTEETHAVEEVSTSSPKAVCSESSDEGKVAETEAAVENESWNKQNIEEHIKNNSDHGDEELVSSSEKVDSPTESPTEPLNKSPVKEISASFAGESSTKDQLVTADIPRSHTEDWSEEKLSTSQVATSPASDEETEILLGPDSQQTQLCNNQKIQVEQADDSLEKNNFLSSLGLSKTDNYDIIKSVSDELMDVMAYESCDNQNGYKTQHSHISEDESEEESDEEYTNKGVREALDYLAQSDSSTTGSIMSVESDALFLSDDDIAIESSLQNSEETSKNLSKKENDQRQLLKECCVRVERADLEKLRKKHIVPVLKECFVKLEKLRVLRCRSISTSSTSSDDSEIERLCDLTTLDRRRRDSLDEKRSEKDRKMKRTKRKRKISSESGSETSDLTGFSSVSESEVDKRNEKATETHNGPLDPNELLTDIICHTIHDTDSDLTPQESDGGDSKPTKKKKNDSKDAPYSKYDKDSWRNHPLLRGNLNLTSGEKTSKEERLKRKREESDDSDDLNMKKLKEEDTDESDSNNKKKRKANLLRRLDPDWKSDSSSSEDSDSIKDSNSDDSDLYSSDSDSCIQILESPVKQDPGEESEKKLGRRNILSVLSNEDLTKETQEAKKAEEQRVMRLEMRNQMRYSQSQENITEDYLVLDTMPDGYEVSVDPGLSKKLYEHQVKGVKFMWDACYESVEILRNSEGTGCILAHNMGLGKTLQVVTLVHTLFRHDVTNTKHVLVVCPLSTVSGWAKEFQSAIRLTEKNNPEILIVCIQSSDDPERKYSRVSRWKSRGGVLILGYEAFEKLTNVKRNEAHKVKILRHALIDPGPDLVVCDEGHLLKNGRSLRTQALMEIRTKRRIALTGTPLQNNLTEYYHMVQFVKPNLLGTKHEFKRQFANPIMNGQYEDSVEADIKLMKKRTHVLHRLLKNTVQRYEPSELRKYLQNLKDYTLFIQLHPLQEQLYRSYIEMARQRKDPKIQRKFNAFFGDYQLVKFICSHPQLLYTMEAQNLQQNKKTIKETDVISQEPEVREVEGIPNGWWKSMCRPDVQTSLELGTKLQIMMAIIDEAERIEEKVLIFTSSLVELSSIEYFLKLKGTPRCPSWSPKRDYFRMDGTVPPALRTMMCDKFNDKNNKTLRLFIMSHKVGGLGLNLVGANRVILLGANFNPSHDTQSIYRAYRFGQEKCVYIYRLLSMGTMEEKIYHRCVTKLAIASRVVDKHQIARHYKNLDLEDLYTVAVDLSLSRATPSKPDDDILANILLRYDSIHKYHLHQKLLENRPDEDLNEEDKIRAWEEFKQMENNNPLLQKGTTEQAKLAVSTGSSAPQAAGGAASKDLVGDILWAEKLRLLNHSIIGNPTNPSPSTITPTQNGIPKVVPRMKKDNRIPSKTPTPLLGMNKDNTIPAETATPDTRINRNNIIPAKTATPEIRMNKDNPILAKTATLEIRKNKDNKLPINFAPQVNQQVNNNVKINTFNKTVSIGPNPFANKKKKNLSQKAELFMKKTSSDDFQKPTQTSKKHNVKIKATPSNSRVQEDDDVILVDSPIQSKDGELRKAMEKLKRNSISISNVQSQKPPENRDSYVIEIL